MHYFELSFFHPAALRFFYKKTGIRKRSLYVLDQFAFP
jgi:hypothetical protein